MEYFYHDAIIDQRVGNEVRARNTYFYKGLEAVVKGLIGRGHAAIRGWPVIFGRNLGKKSPGMWRGTMPG